MLSCSSLDEVPFQPAVSQFESRFPLLGEDLYWLLLPGSLTGSIAGSLTGSLKRSLPEPPETFYSTAQGGVFTRTV